MSTSMLQLYGCLNRVVIEKRRNARVTCCECCSHLIIVLILVFGYSLSIVEYFKADKYSDIEVRIPPIVGDDTQDALYLYNNITSGPLIVPTLDQYIALNDFLSNNIDQLGPYGNILSQTALGRTYTNLLYKGGLHFAPEGAEVSSLIEFMNTSYPRFSTLDVFVHETEKFGVQYILDNLENPALALIVLHQVTPEKVNYEIRQNYTTLPNTNQVVVDTVIGLNTEYQSYFFSGFFSLEKAVNEWAFNYTNAISNAQNPTTSPQCTGPPEIVLTPFPTPAYDQNPFYTQVGFLLGLAIVMSTMYPMSRLTKSVVEEKELKMREVTKIMGLREWVHQLSWFLSAFVLFFWITVSCTFITQSSFLVHSNGAILFAYFFLFCMSEINFAFFVSVFFSNSKLAAIVAPVVLFAGILPRFAFLNTNANELVAGKTLACLLSPTAFAFGADIIASYEYSGVGVQFSNVNDGLFNFNTVLFMMWADFFIYGFLAWYLDQVIPHEYGTPQHPLFFLSFRFWCPRSRPRETSDTSSTEAALQNMPEFFDPSSNGSADSTGGASSIEAIPEDMRHMAKVRILNLRKRYPDGNLAVRDLSLSMTEGQITCLLGHNGAGKTTTISTLTGMIEATSGDVSIYGCSLKYDLPAIRQLTGVCPQHNVLYPTLTVLEHLFFFGNIKGMYGARLRNSVEAVISEVGLTEKRNALSAALSGGMKRKLSLAIALIGDPKFLLLDEPTSGMDPYSRRSTWELLQKSKVGRVVLLTTHFMEEADTLADRIAIMSEGTLRCSGSSLFLKSQFGVGYLLSVSKARPDALVGPIEAVVRGVVPDARVTSSIAGEVIFQMPLSNVPLFAGLFRELKATAEGLGVGSYGISLTTLEQVFISLAKEAKAVDHHEDLDDHAGDWQYWLKKYVTMCARSSVDAIYDCSPWRRQATRVGSRDIELMDANGEKAQDTPPADEIPALVAQYEDVAEAFECPKSFSATAAGQYQPVQINETTVATVPSAASAVSAPLVDSTKAAARKDNYHSDGFSRGTVSIQFIELYRKRLIIASRDVKGLFFQVIFPALQILLIMLILTVSVNPAGQTITLNARMFDKEADIVPGVTVAGALRSELYRDNLNSADMSLAYSNVTNSSALSDLLLDPDFYVEDRFGAYVFGDQIPLNLTVDWNWVKANIDSLGQVVEVIPGGEDAVNSFLADNLQSLDVTLPDTDTNEVADYIDDANLSAAEEFFMAAFNISIIDALNVSAVVPGTQAQFDIGGVVYNAADNTFTITGVTLVIGNTTVQLANSTVAATTFAQLLPSTVQSFAFNLPSRYTAMHNSTSPHGAAAFYGELVATAFQQCSPAGGATGSTQYLVKNRPLPITTQQALEIQVILALLTSIFILVPLCYIPASFVSFLVKERVSKSKHLQIVSSVSPYLYWLATYAWDMTLFLALIGFILIAFFSFGSAAEVFIHSGESTLALFTLLLMYGLSAIPLSYLYSLCFENFSTAQISIMVINFITGFVMVLAYYILIAVPSTEAIGHQLVHFFRFFPPYNVGEGLINLSAAFYYNTVQNRNVGYFDWNITGRNIVFMLAEAVGYFGAVLLTEFTPLLQLGYWLERKRVSYIPAPPPPRNGFDKDVQEEAERARNIPIVDTSKSPRLLENRVQDVLSRHDVPDVADPLAAGVSDDLEEGNGDVVGSDLIHSSDPKCSLLIRDLVKTYPPSLLGGQPKHAVRGVSLACSDGERFGLLGINGAGKTTTLGILTGDLQATSGEVFIGGRPLSDPATMSMIGYCPQVDPLLDLMNGFETLWFFGRIRGIPSDVLQQRIDDLIVQVGLERFAHKPCGTYSGGNKRKLSLAVALIGDPRVLFLDEPSTGMDPEARRNMWTVIEQVSAQRSVVLVTHSMEEVEALCTRMGVMVSGRLQCIGSAQHLKGRFGLGYQVEIRSIPARVQECIALCERVMVQVVVEEVHGGYVRLKVNKEVDLAGAFSALEEHKAALSILDYSISQCTLEQVFLKFAKDQEEETGQVAGLNTIGAALNSNDGGQSSDGLGDVQKIQHGSETGEVLAQPGQVRVAYSASSAEPSSVNKLGDDVLVFRADCAGAEGPIPHDLLEEPERKEDDFTK